MVDPFLSYLKDDLPRGIGELARSLGVANPGALQDTLAAVGGAAGLNGAIYGLIIIVFIVFEPYGLYGRWLKIRLYFELFPLYKKATFRRQKTYVKSERNR
jgi:branched-chain amino acid transport system permease protein